jgi:excisionase family DNA binding protein
MVPLTMRGYDQVTDRYDWPSRMNRIETEPSVPFLLTVDETAALLRTSRKAIYSMVERGQLPGVTRVGRRVLFRSRDLLDFLDHNSTPSPRRTGDERDDS